MLGPHRPASILRKSKIRLLFLARCRSTVGTVVPGQISARLRSEQWLAKLISVLFDSLSLWFPIWTRFSQFVIPDLEVSYKVTADHVFESPD
jgi:hypothetical protein